MIDDRYLQMYMDEPRFPLWDMVLLIFIYEKQTGFIEALHGENFIEFDVSVRYLEENGYAKRFGPNPADLTLRQRGVDLFKKYVGTKSKKKQNDVHTWIDQWREIFPKGSNQSGYRYRGNRLEALKKMTKFVEQYDFTKEEIFQATKNYVDKFALKGYMYMQQAHYFIDKKDSGSSLASECEGVQERVDNPVKERSDYGERLI